MADLSFDVVYAGGGYGALMSAPYFGMNGMSVGIFDALPELGGGHASDARPIPGFVGNPHASGLVAQMAPQVQDFKIWEKGGFFHITDDRMGLVYPDNTGFKIKLANKWDMYTGQYTFDQDVFEENYESLARVSKKDADTSRMMFEKMIRSWFMPMMEHWLNPPAPYGEEDSLEKLFYHPVDPIDPRYQYMSCVEVVKELYEDPKYRTFLTRITLSLGIWPNDTLPAGMMLLITIAAALGVSGAGNWVGGSHQIIHALQRKCADYAIKSYVNKEVDEVIVENGIAKGIRLVDGTEIEAKKMVVTNVDPRQLTFRFLRNFPISEEIKRKLRNIPADNATLFWGNMAAHEKPLYNAEDYCPGISDSSAVYMGPPDIEYLERKYKYEHQNIKPGQWPEKMFFLAQCHQSFDPSLAPPGKYNALVEEFGPAASDLTEREWLQLRKEIGPRMIKEWQKYASNMTEDKFIGWEIDTPGDIARRDPPCIEGSWQMGVSPRVANWGRFRPIPEYCQYQVPGIDNLFCTGIGWHADFGSPAGFAYSMYKKAAAKYGLREFWKEAGRPW